MVRTNKIIGLTIILASTLFFTSCEKEFDAPPIKENTIGDIITIADLKAKRVANNNVDLKITEDLSLYAVVTMDELTGNLFKESYIQDATGAINVRLTSAGGLYQGDSIRISLKGPVITEFSQMMQLDSVDVDDNIFKQATQKDRTPELVSSVSAITPFSGHQSKLIRLENVQFVAAELPGTYAVGATQTTENHFLEDAASTASPIIVRTSGFANFADDSLPTLNGSIIAIVSQFNNDMQLLIRNPNEVNFVNPRTGPCVGIATTKDFTDANVTSGGWTTQNVSGSINWATGGTSNLYGVITNTSSQLVGETWYISPAIDFSTSSCPSFDFRSATFAGNTALELYVSSNYDGVSLPTTATWVQLFPTLSSGGWSWANSGSMDLSAYQQAGVYVAFKYTGSSSAWNTWEVDDLKITK